MPAVTQLPAVAARPRGFVGVTGPDAEEHLNRMVSNDVAALEPGQSCDALLLTPKARLVAPMRVLRRAADDFLLLTEPELAQILHDALQRTRFRARCELAVERHTSHVLLGVADVPSAAARLPCPDYGVEAVEVLDAPPPPDLPPVAGDVLERLRIEAGTPAFGRELDERVLPAETGLVERAVSFSKGCYPGQEPVARQHYRGRVNRTLRVLTISTVEPPAYDAAVTLDGRPVGRVTSAVPTDDGAVVALGYLRAEVPPEAQLEVEGRPARVVPAGRGRAESVWERDGSSEGGAVE